VIEDELYEDFDLIEDFLTEIETKNKDTLDGTSGGLIYDKYKVVKQKKKKWPRYRPRPWEPTHPEYNATEDFMLALEERNKGFANGFYIVFIYGEQGMGKTKVAIRITEKRIQDVQQFHGITPNYYWGFIFDETQQATGKAKQWDIIAQVETEQGMGKQTQLNAIALKNLIRVVVRQAGICFVFVRPDPSEKIFQFLKPTFILHVREKTDPDAKLKYNKCMLKILDPDDYKVVDYGWVNLKLTENKELDRELSTLEERHKMLMKKEMGYTGATVSQSKENRDTQRVIEWYNNYEYKEFIQNKTGLAAELPYGFIKGGTGYQDKIITKAWNRIQILLKQNGDITIDKPKPIEILEVNNFSDPRDYLIDCIAHDYGEIEAQVMKQFFYNPDITALEISQMPFFQDTPYKHNSNISRLIKKIGLQKIGEYYEFFVRKQYNDKRTDFGTGIPDVLVNCPELPKIKEEREKILSKIKDVISVKCRMTNSRECGAFSPLIDMLPEYKFCEEHHLEGFKLVFYNPLWKEPYCYQEAYIDMEKPLKRISFFNFKDPHISY